MRATASKAAKNVIHNVRLEQWQEAEEKYYVFRDHFSSRLSFGNLQGFQLALWERFKENPKALHGEPLLVIARADGAILPDFPYPGTVLKTVDEGGQLYLKVLYHPIEEEEWAGERVEFVALFQVMPLDDKKQPTAEFLKDIQLSILLGNLNTVRNQAKNQLISQKTTIQANIKSITKDLTRYEKQLTDVETMIEKANEDNLTLDDLKEKMDQLAHHKKVDWAFLTTDGELIVQTKMLHPISPKVQKENPNKPIGRFAFRIRPVDSGIEAMNMDYIGGSGNMHPNLSGTSICMGENGNLIISMIKSGEFYDLVDFLIGFFSLFPHDSGRPYVSHKEWLRTKRENSTPNPWISGRTKLYEVHHDDKTDTRELKKKGKKTLLAKLRKTVAEKEGVEQAPTSPTVAIDLAPNLEEIVFDEPVVGVDVALGGAGGIGPLMPGVSASQDLIAQLARQTAMQAQAQVETPDGTENDSDEEQQRYDEDGNPDSSGSYDENGDYIED